MEKQTVPATVETVAAHARVPRSKIDLLPQFGFHNAKDQIQITYMKSQTEQILANLDDFITYTWENAPVRDSKHHYYLSRNENRVPQNRKDRRASWVESLWEEAIFRYYKNSAEGLPFEKILAYQSPLRNSKSQDKAWGKIDLIACKSGLPLIIELKTAISGEPILRAILEVTAYAIAIRKSWEQKESQLRKDWQKIVGDNANDLPEKLSSIPCTIMATEQYWISRFNEDANSSPDKTPLDARPVLQRLIACLAKKGYPISFVELHHDGLIRDTFPRITGANINKLATDAIGYTP